MSGESEHRTYKWVLPLVVGVFCGGLGGSVFTWYINRPKSTVVTYTITSTTIAAAKSASGLVPGLKVMIDSEQVASLYTFNIEFRPRQGPYSTASRSRWSSRPLIPSISTVLRSNPRRQLITLTAIKQRLGSSAF